MIVRHDMAMPRANRDPLSVLMDGPARALLDKAYATPGQWASTRLADPSMAQIRYANSLGIYPLSPDTAAGKAAKTRWARAFVRALYYQHKWYSSGGGPGFRSSRRTTARTSGALVVEVGRALTVSQRGPAGRAVRVKLARGGQAKERAVDRKGESETWRDHGPRWADPARRDW